MKIDLHCHSEASWDCVTPLESFPQRCRERGIRVQAITDHDEIWGAQELQRMAQGTDLTVIVGEEVTSAQGEIIGLFLTERIEPGLSAVETVRRIRQQGGLVLLPHGFDPLKTKRLQPKAVLEIAKEIDIVEAFNTRVSKTRFNDEAREWARANGRVISGGSDAHTLRDVGSAWNETPDVPIATPHDLMQALAAGQVDGKWVHPVPAFAYKAFDWARHRWTTRKVPKRQAPGASPTAVAP